MNIKFIVLIFPFLLMTACDKFGEPESMMDQYLIRLARVLEQPAVASPLPVLTKLPDKKERTLNLPEMDVNMLEFLSFYGCELQVVVAERNSILGRVMLPINQLRYEIRFIESAKQCLTSVDDGKTRDILQQAITQKRAALPAVFWNAIWSTEEIAQLLTYSKGYLSLDENVTQSTVAGLKQLVQIKKQIDNQQLDINLQQLGEIHQQWLYSHQAGKLLKSAQLLTTRLNDASDIIKKRLSDRPLCYQQHVTPQAEIVHSFFLNIYIGKVQPYLASVSQQSMAIFPLLNELSAVKGDSHLSDDFEGYRQLYLDPSAAFGVWQKLQQAIELHTKSWQTLLEQCGMRPAVKS